MNRLSIVLALMLLTAAPFSVAEPIRIIGLSLEYRLDEEASSQYGLLLAEMKELGFNFELELYPFERFWREISEDRTSCHFPSVIVSTRAVVTDVPDGGFIAADPVDYPTYRVLVRPGEPVITSLDQLAGKRVAGALGFPHAAFLGERQVDIEETNSEVSRARMLMRNRVDAVLSFIPDFHMALDELGFEQVTSDGAYKLLPNVDGTGLICYNTPENVAAVKEFNRVLTILKDNGRLKEILGPFAQLEKQP